MVYIRSSITRVELGQAVHSTNLLAVSLTFFSFEREIKTSTGKHMRAVFVVHIDVLVARTLSFCVAINPIHPPTHQDL